jgi:hypothetical protein
MEAHVSYEGSNQAILARGDYTVFSPQQGPASSNYNSLSQADASKTLSLHQVSSARIVQASAVSFLRQLDSEQCKSVRLQSGWSQLRLSVLRYLARTATQHLSKLLQTGRNLEAGAVVALNDPVCWTREELAALRKIATKPIIGRGV